jgi:hypothetical protein
MSVCAVEFEIDHIVPEGRGDLATSDNLALACPGCNGRKWAFESAQDPETGSIVPLYNPRLQIWGEHFRWSTDGLKIEGVSPIGRATVVRLQMNHPRFVTIRQFFRGLGISIATPSPE